MDLQLAGKRAIVTGASRGIGLAVARVLAEEGAHVALVAREQATLDHAGEQLVPGSRRLSIVADTTDDSAVQAMVGRVVGEWGGVDILVNAAARPGDPNAARVLADLRDEDLRTEIETKVLGYLRCVRAVVPHMRAQGWGRIVNISGLAARHSGNTFGSIRNVAVAAMTKNLADELGPEGINVTVVHPGFTVTERTPAVLDQVAGALGIDPAQARARMTAGVSIARLITAAEVADVVAFLASPRSVAITGEAIAAGGGERGPIYY